MKYEDEITVMVYDGCEELIDKIISRGFKKIDDYMLYDMYMVYKDVIVNGSENDKEILKILSKCVLIRSIDDNKHYITYKYKEYDDDGNIVKQGKCNCRIENASSGVEIVKCLGYDRELIRINDHIMVYEKDGLELAIEYVNDKYLFIEVEANQKYDTIDKMKNTLEEVGIEYDKSNYFQKKALLIFKDKYNSKI